MGGHPALTFASTKVQQRGTTSFKVTGDLTIRGVTKSVTADFELTGAENDPRGDFRVSPKVRWSLRSPRSGSPDGFNARL